MTRFFSEKVIDQTVQYFSVLHEIASQQSRSFAAQTKVQDGTICALLWQVQETKIPFTQRVRFSKRLLGLMQQPQASIKHAMETIHPILKVGFILLGASFVRFGTLWVQLCLLPIRLKGKSNVKN